MFTYKFNNGYFFLNFSLFFPYLNYSNDESSHLPMAFKKAEGLMRKEKRRMNLMGFIFNMLLQASESLRLIHKAAVDYIV